MGNMWYQVQSYIYVRLVLHVNCIATLFSFVIKMLDVPPTGIVIICGRPVVYR